MKSTEKQIKWANEIIDHVGKRTKLLQDKRPGSERTKIQERVLAILQNAPHAKYVISYKQDGFNAHKMDEYIEYHKNVNQIDLSL